MNWATFFNMGGYAFHVWSSYLLAAIILGVNVWIPLRKFRAQQKKLKKQHETTS